MSSSFFPTVERISYKGPETTDPLAFRYYDPERVVLGKKMADHLRMAVCYWHTFCWPGADMFGAPSFERPWHAADTLEMAEMKTKAAFEFFEKLGLPYFAFHDADVAPLGNTVAEGDRALAHMEALIHKEMERTGVKLLWGTANLFSHPRYMAGAATNPDPEVFGHAAVQVARVMEMTQRLGGENYVLWGGREGYETLLNTDMKRELDQLGRFMTMVVEHKHKIGFKGMLLIEPKPMEPTKHQYDFDAATVHGFLRKYGLEKEIALNIEVNHATLAGHTYEHEIVYAIANGLLGSFDLNRGDPQNGWDTDQFPNDPAEAAMALYHILRAGGLTSGGFNFDAKVRRQSIDAEDLFYAHIGGADVLAHGLLIAAKMIEDGTLAKHVDERYAGWNAPVGRDILDGRLSLDALAKKVRAEEWKPARRSGRQEYLENLVNRYL